MSKVLVRPGPNRCSVVLTRNCKDLERISNWGCSNWLIIWADPNNKSGIVELNYRLAALTKEHEEAGVIFSCVFVDLQAAGFPPMDDREYDNELRRITHKYVEFVKTSYADVESYYFV